MDRALDLFDHDYSVSWPPNDRYPLNLPSPHDRSVEGEILKDLENSGEFLVITGFTSLSYLIDLYYKKPFLKNCKLRIVLGFEPIVRQRKRWPKIDFSNAVKEYWIDKRVSPLKSGGIINLIEEIERGQVRFRVSEKIHAKIYVGEQYATLGSSNFSLNGLKKQSEANIRVNSKGRSKNEKQQYDDIRLIAENFYNESEDYKEKILELLHLLAKPVEWPEALARAMAELLEGTWIDKYPDAFKHLEELELWPSQRMAIGQALQIIDSQGSLLVADPTGSGKTKLASSLQLSLINRRWVQGKGHRTNSLVVCPPSIIDNWESEYENMRFAQQRPLSNGILSYESSKKHNAALKKVKNCDILIIDEAHNYLNAKSARSFTLKNSLADCIMLVTATPINKKAEDLLRLIELLDIDNLNDKELEEYKKLRKTNRTKSLSHYQQLREYVRKFTVRRTKKQLNQLILKDKESYKNREGKLCKYPKHICDTYNTGETESDKKKATLIEELAVKLKGLINLRKLFLPFDHKDDLESKASYLERRLITSKALAKYHVQAKLRSSRVALYEHVVGTSVASDHYGFKPTKKETGNVIKTLERFIESGTLPKTDLEDAILPDYIKDLEAYHKACKEEIHLYEQIAEIGNSISDQRELTKITKIKSLFKKHRLVLAFDSTLITLDYLNHLINRGKYNFKTLVVTGENDSNKEKAKKIFELGSKEKNYLGLCSDAMSEGVNLQQASSIVLLDMPSVLRIAEQRIGRLDRMDSPHKRIYAWWPKDSEEFALKTDKKLVRISYLTGHLIGSNLDLPNELIGTDMSDVIQTEEMIKEFENAQEKSESWDGIHDAFQPVRNLMEGENPMVSLVQYEYYKNIETEVLCKVSIVKTSQKFGFFAIKGTERRAPKWVFIDSDNTIEHELPKICEHLTLALSKVENSEWDHDSHYQMQFFLRLLLRNEIQLLPQKKKRAIELLFSLLEIYNKKEKQPSNRKTLIQKLKNALTPNIYSEESVDYHEFAEYWLDIIQPDLIEMRKKSSARYPKVISDLFPLYKKSPFSDEVLLGLYNHIPYVEKIENRIVACIVGVPKNG